MKSVFLLTLLLALTPFSISANPYKIAQEDQAFAEAQEQGKTVAYVFGWTGWGPLIAAREAALTNAQKKCIVISVGFNAEFYKNASPLVSSQIAASSKNILISPQVIIVSDDGNQIIANVRGSQTADKSGFQAAFQAVDDFLEEGTLMKQPTNLTWYIDTKGSHRELEFRGLSEKGFVLKNGKNKPRNFAFNSFLPGALKFAKRYNAYHEGILVEAAVKEVSQSFATPTSEEWISADGKKLLAEYVSLNDQDELTLVVKKTDRAPQNYTLHLDKFDEPSQAKAHQWKTLIKEQTEKIENAKADAIRSKTATNQKKRKK